MATDFTLPSDPPQAEGAWVLQEIARPENSLIAPPVTVEERQERDALAHGVQDDFAAQATLLRDPLAAKYFQRDPQDLQGTEQDQQKRLALYRAQNKRIIDSTPTFTRLADLTRQGYYNLQAAISFMGEASNLRQLRAQGFNEEDALDYTDWQRRRVAYEELSREIITDPDLDLVMEKGEGLLDYLVKRPGAIFDLTAGALAPSGATWIGGAVGGVGGLALGRNPTAAYWGATAGAVLASGGVDYLMYFQDALAEEGLDFANQPPEQALKMLREPSAEAAWQRAHDKATKRAGMIGASAYASMLFAPWKLKKGPAFVRHTVNLPGKVVGLGVLEAAGEAGAQWAAGQDLNRAEILAEGLVGGMLSVVEVASVRSLVNAARK